MSFSEAPVTELSPLERKILIEAIERELWLLKFIAGPYKRFVPRDL